jgi:acetylornithine aminotransferase
MHKDVLAKEKIFKSEFEKLRQRFPKQIKEVRGRGLILGLQLSEDPTPVITAARERGLMIITCGTNTLRFVPPLVITEEEIRSGVAILGEALDVVFKQRQEVEGTKGQEEMQDS